MSRALPSAPRKVGRGCRTAAASEQSIGLLGTAQAGLGQRSGTAYAPTARRWSNPPLPSARLGQALLQGDTLECFGVRGLHRCGFRVGAVAMQAGLVEIVIRLQGHPQIRGGPARSFHSQGQVD